MKGKTLAEGSGIRPRPATQANTKQPSAVPEVVIVTHNAGHLLAEATESAVAQAGADHVWLVDAESTDGSVAALRTGPTAAVHVLPVRNTGFAAANNRGLEATHSDLVLLLNPDAALLPGALAALTATAQAHPEAGIIGALVLNEDDTVQAGSFGRFPSLCTVLGAHLRRSAARMRRDTRLSPRAPTTTTPVDWVTGAAMLVRRAAVQDVGPLDEGFFLYYEDVDWCRRMHARGWKVLLEPAARVRHHLGSSGAPREAVAQAYRESFYRYCGLYHLWGLKTAARLGLSLRRLWGGAL